ncbi:MAG: bifunctional alpha,alpha-trehalose-phosphate synthase (UDP-forming)/trehalose-phosphatase [Myxococcales bacterium]|nr:bifunctional alpha,alpha-trehalose-phosphate synthase (UDP-forming)/trehalose-phosphatase [Myxococcales bacterium]
MSRVLIVSNRLPISVSKREEGIEVSRSTGGLATGLSGVHEASGGRWIGWPGVADDALSDADRQQLGPRFEELRVVPVPLAEAEIHRYYEDFCNGILWPLFHYLMGKLPLEFDGFDLYETVNQRFADAIVANHQPGDVVWVHDYHLMLVPQMVRERLPDATIGYFLHIPFPSSEVFRTLPFRERLLEGLLGADLVGFHTAAYARHFTSSALRVLGATSDVTSLQWGHRQVHTGVFPMGIDVEGYRNASAKPEVNARAEELRARDGNKLVFGLDRLDYTKGIPRRLLAFERLLQRHPELHGKVQLVQCGTASRTNVEAYQEFRSQVEGLVGRILGTYATPDWVPVNYILRGLPFEENLALYKAADVMLVTPIRDGMNLVAKEFVAARDDEDGVLVLSEFAGASSDLPEALSINPYDVEGTAEVLYRALTMPKDDRHTRMVGLRKRVLGASVQAWADRFVSTLRNQAHLHPATKPTRSDELARLLARVRDASSLVLFLDYDGSLVPFAPTPDLAKPDEELLSLLRGLAARPNTFVNVVSGRDRTTLARWLGPLPLALHAEHGSWSRPVGGEGRENLITGVLDWREPALEILRDFAAHTPGSLVEEKVVGVAWHYRMAEPDFGARQANELRLHLLERFANAPVEILSGERVVELRPHGVNKGRVVGPLAEAHPGALLVAIGDDRTDEDMFAALPPGHVALHVGPGASRAEFRVAGVKDVRAFLKGVLAPEGSR